MTLSEIDPLHCTFRVARAKARWLRMRVCSFALCWRRRFALKFQSQDFTSKVAAHHVNGVGKKLDSAYCISTKSPPTMALHCTPRTNTKRCRGERHWLGSFFTGCCCPSGGARFALLLFIIALFVRATDKANASEHVCLS
jgi:hypothetical protein